MSNPEKNLKLVLSQDGSEPLVLASCWETETGVEIEKISLKDKEYIRGKDRRRALCILFLLAKLPRRIQLGSDGIIHFEDESPAASWIKLFGNASRYGNLDEWVSKYFPRVNGQILVQAHRHTESTIASVQYNSKVLPVRNLKLYVRLKSTSGTVDEEISGVRLLTTALKLEKALWNRIDGKTCINILLENDQLKLSKQILLEAKKLGVGASSQSQTTSDEPTADELFIKTKAQLWNNPNWDVDRTGFEQMRVDYDSYYECCNSLFTHIANCRNSFSPTNAHIQNRYQADFFQRHCLAYAYLVRTQYAGALNNCEFGPVASSHLKRLDLNRWEDLYLGVEAIFENFATKNRISHIRIADDKLPIIEVSELDVIGEFVSEEYRVAPSSAYVLGILIGMRVCYNDFLTNICVPLLKAFDWESGLPADFLNNCAVAQMDISILIRTYGGIAGDGQGAVAFIMGFRQILKLHAYFWVQFERLFQKLAKGIK